MMMQKTTKVVTYMNHEIRREVRVIYHDGCPWFDLRSLLHGTGRPDWIQPNLDLIENSIGPYHSMVRTMPCSDGTADTYFVSFYATSLILNPDYHDCPRYSDWVLLDIIPDTLGLKK